METTIENWGFIGIMEKKMEATVVKWDWVFRVQRPELAYTHRGPYQDVVVVKFLTAVPASEEFGTF